MNIDVEYDMYNEECLTEKVRFSQKPRAAFSLFAGVRKSPAQFFACRPLFAETRKNVARVLARFSPFAEKRTSALRASVSCASALHTSASHSFASHVFRAPAGILRKFALVGVCLSFVSCTNIFQDKVAMSRSGTSATLGDIFVGGAVVGELNAPSQIVVSQYEYSNKICVSWSPVKNAKYYTLKRAYVVKDENGEWKNQSENDSMNWETIGQIFGTSHTDTLIKENSMDSDDALDYKNKKYGRAYYYSVSAGNKLSGYDDSKEKTSTWGTLLPPPSNTKASLGSSEEYIKITWNGTDGAQRYEVWRSSQTDGKNATLIKRLYPNETSYQDNDVSQFKGADLFYTVRSVGSKDTSVASSVAMGYTLRPGAPKQVSTVIVTKGHGEDRNSIDIKWEAVGGIFYRIMRSERNGNENTNTMVELADGISVDGDFGTYTDDGSKAQLKQNTYYYYYVQSYKKETVDGEETENKGPFSNSGPAADIDDKNPSFDKYAEGFILSAPSSVEVQKPDIESKDDPYTIWFEPSIGDKNFSEGAKGEKYANNYEYVVFGGESENGAFTVVGKALSNSLNFNGNKKKYSFTLNAVKYKFYKMQAKNAGQESEQTEAVAPAPYAPMDVYVTCAALVGDPNNYKPDSRISSAIVEKDPGTNDNGVHPVKIMWTAPEGDDAAYYNIYRKEKFDEANPESGWVGPINEEPVIGTYYIDENGTAKVGTIYYYSVISLNSLKQGANRSAVFKPTVGSNNIIETTDIVVDGKSLRCGRGWGWGALSAWQYMQEQRKTIESSQSKLEIMKKTGTQMLGRDEDSGALGGTIKYQTDPDHFSVTAVSGVEIYITYTDYADFNIQNKPELGVYFKFDGPTNTKIGNVGAQSGNMFGTLGITGMYPGTVRYDNIQIKGGAAQGGTYGVIRDGIDTECVEVWYMAGEK